MRIPGAPESKPILLKLYPSGEGFRFSSSNSDSESSRNAPSTPTVILTLALLVGQEPQPQHGITFAPERIANFIGTGVIRGVDTLVRTGSDLIGWLPKRRTSTAQPHVSGRARSNPSPAATIWQFSSTGQPDSLTVCPQR